MKLPKSLYARIQDDNEGCYMVASDNMGELGINFGDKVKIGLYKLEGIYDAEGTIETGHMKKV